MILNVENLSIHFTFGSTLKPVIRKVSFQVGPGEILGVVGESGCGKSMVNLAIMGLLPFDAMVEADRFELCNKDLLRLERRHWPAIRGGKAAMIFQNPISALNPSLTVGTQLIETIRKADPSGDRRQNERLALDLLNQVGLTSARLRLKSYPHELSGGMAQRVMIAMSLACKPALLIADEPTTALDATIQVQILDLLARICRDSDMAVILVSHDISVVQDYADRIQVMYSGEIVETGPAHTVTRRPAHPYTRGLLQSLPGRQGLTPKVPLPTIRGAVPPIDAVIAGCRFAPRCPKVQPICQVPPALALRADTAALVRCHL